MDGVGLDFAHQIVRLVAGEIDACPAGHEHQRAVVGDVIEVVAELGPRLLIGLVDDDGQEVVDPELGGIAANRSGAGTHVTDVILQDGLGLRSDEDAFGMFRGKLLARPRGPGLIEHRGALRRGFGERIARHLEEATLVADLVDLRRVGEDPLLAIPKDGPLFPGTFEQLVDHLEIFVGHLVAVVMRAQPALPDILCTAL